MDKLTAQNLWTRADLDANSTLTMDELNRSRSERLITREEGGLLLELFPPVRQSMSQSEYCLAINAKYGNIFSEGDMSWSAERKNKVARSERLKQSQEPLRIKYEGKRYSLYPQNGYYQDIL
ncbi:MAG: hypothetical protein Q7S00_01970, partial [bacterium]|nr:hypothetical protein [bacterium]